MSRYCDTGCVGTPAKNAEQYCSHVDFPTVFTDGMYSSTLPPLYTLDKTHIKISEVVTGCTKDTPRHITFQALQHDTENWEWAWRQGS